jgi:kynureninase
VEAEAQQAFRAAYSRFGLDERILLSAHSHQAWPDVAREAQLEVFDDAARHVDEKWQQTIIPLMDEMG